MTQLAHVISFQSSSRLMSRDESIMLYFSQLLCFWAIPQIFANYAKEITYYAEEITLYAPVLQILFQKMQLNTAHN